MINTSKNAADFLHPVNILNTEKNELQKIYENVKNQVEATHNMLEQPEVLRTAMITAFRNAVKTEVENCIDCEEKTSLEEIYKKLVEADEESLKNLLKPANNTNYKPADTLAT